MIIQAYYTAALQRVKKMPKLDKLLKDIGKPKKKGKMSAEEMFEVVKELNAAFGGD